MPHSEIHGSKLVRSSPRLIAAYHVLHRLSAPRHPPDALKALDRSHAQCPPRRQASTRKTSVMSGLARSGVRSSAPVPKGHRTSPLFTMSKNRRPRSAAPSRNSVHGRADPSGGARRDRTDDLLLAKQALSQLSYGPAGWWAWVELNYRPHAYQACALTT